MSSARPIHFGYDPPSSDPRLTCGPFQPPTFAADVERAVGVALQEPPFAGTPAGLIDHLGDLVELGFDAFQLVFGDVPPTMDIESFIGRTLPAFRGHA